MFTLTTVGGLAIIVAKLSAYGLGAVGLVSGAEWFNQFKVEPRRRKGGAGRGSEHPNIESLRQKIRG